ncbi:MAG: hypothetical protein KA052_00830 [Candidatus Pacebacteria bacterium]|nr:hypothetical protein [Candidatus Paceibacterota bacterium]
MQPTSNKTTPIIIGVFVIVAVVLVTMFSGKKSTEAPTIPDTTSQVPPADTSSEIPPIDTPKETSSTYKDGTYTAIGGYMSPGGANRIQVTVTLKKDIVTDTSAVEMAGDPKSVHFQTLFIGGYKTFVIGKNLDDVNVGKVSGSSLTATGFNEAIAKIKTQAKA